MLEKVMVAALSPIFLFFWSVALETNFQSIDVETVGSRAEYRIDCQDRAGRPLSFKGHDRGHYVVASRLAISKCDVKKLSPNFVLNVTFDFNQSGEKSFKIPANVAHTEFHFTYPTAERVEGGEPIDTMQPDVMLQNNHPKTDREQKWEKSYKFGK